MVEYRHLWCSFCRKNTEQTIENEDGKNIQKITCKECKKEYTQRIVETSVIIQKDIWENFNGSNNT